MGNRIKSDASNQTPVSCERKQPGQILVRYYALSLSSFFCPIYDRGEGTHLPEQAKDTYWQHIPGLACPSQARHPNVKKIKLCQTFLMQSTCQNNITHGLSFTLMD
jgi:hypothetical protein